MQNGREEAIRNRAYELWEQEGRPDGQPDSHWYRAEQELDGDAEASSAPDGGLASGLQAGGVKPASQGSMGSIGTGGGSTAGEPSGSVRRAAEH